MPWEIVGRTRGNTYYWDWVDRDGEEIFNDPKLNARGILVAFDPYVPRG